MRGAAPVEERKRKLDGRVLCYPCEGLERATGRAVLRYRMPRAVDLAGGAVRVPADAVSYGVYWTDRPYNVYRWVDAAGRTLAWYCNAACETVISPDAVEWLDLEVDVLVTPDMRVRVLDAEELPADLSPPRREALNAAVAHLTRHAPQVVREVDAITAARLRGWR